MVRRLRDGQTAAAAIDRLANIEAKIVYRGAGNMQAADAQRTTQIEMLQQRGIERSIAPATSRRRQIAVGIEAIDIEINSGR